MHYSLYLIINPLEPKIRVLGETFQFLVDGVLVTYLGYIEKQEFLSESAFNCVFKKNIFFHKSRVLAFTARTGSSIRTLLSAKSSPAHTLL